MQKQIEHGCLWKLDDGMMALQALASQVSRLRFSYGPSLAIMRDHLWSELSDHGVRARFWLGSDPNTNSAFREAFGAKGIWFYQGLSGNRVLTRAFGRPKIDLPSPE